MATQPKTGEQHDDTMTSDEIDRRMFDCGASSWLELLDGTRVRKAVQPWIQSKYLRKAMITDMRNEIDIYNHLPKGHPRFLPMLSSHDTGADVGLELPYLPIGSLRTYLETHHIDDKPDGTPFIPARLRARWAVEIADGIGFLHQHDVIHCDMKPHNMLLDSTLGVRIIDMAGSRLGDRGALCCESDRFYMPRAHDQGTVITDLFAVGMSLFEIITGAQPYGEIADRCEIIARYERGEFPSLEAVRVADADPSELPAKFITKFKGSPLEVGHGAAPANISAAARARAPTDASGREVLFAGVMRRCWHGQFASAAVLLAALAEEIRATFSDADVSYIEEVSGLSLQEETVGSRLRPDETGWTALRTVDMLE